jgi:hypothetical protein
VQNCDKVVHYCLNQRSHSSSQSFRCVASLLSCLDAHRLLRVDVDMLQSLSRRCYRRRCVFRRAWVAGPGHWDLRSSFFICFFRPWLSEMAPCLAWSVMADQHRQEILLPDSLRIDDPVYKAYGGVLGSKGCTVEVVLRRWIIKCLSADRPYITYGCSTFK